MGQFNGCGSVRNDVIFNSHLGSGTDPCLKVLIMLALKLFTFAMLLMIISLSNFQLKILGLNLVNQGWDFRMI